MSKNTVPRQSSSSFEGTDALPSPDETLEVIASTVTLSWAESLATSVTRQRVRKVSSLFWRNGLFFISSAVACAMRCSTTKASPAWNFHAKVVWADPGAACPRTAMINNQDGGRMDELDLAPLADLAFRSFFGRAKPQAKQLLLR